jgi:hypothetical protein
MFYYFSYEVWQIDSPKLFMSPVGQTAWRHIPEDNNLNVMTVINSNLHV